MQATVETDKLLAALSVVSTVIDQKAIIPVLSNVLVRCNGGLELIGSDTQSQVSVRVECEATGDPISIPAKKFLDIVKGLPPGTATSISGSEKAVVKCGRSKYQMTTVPANGFPFVELDNAKAAATIGAEVLGKMIRRVRHSIAPKAHPHHHLKGIQVSIYDTGKVRMEATSGHMISMTAPEGGSIMARGIIPDDAIAGVVRTIKDQESATISISENHVVISSGANSICVKKIFGAFPDLEPFLRKQTTMVCVVNREEIVAACRRAIVCSNKFAAVILTSSAGLLSIQSANEQRLDEGEEVIDAETEEGSKSAVFNGEYVLDVLEAMDCEKVPIDFMATADQPAIVVRDDFSTHIIAGVRL